MIRAIPFPRNLAIPKTIDLFTPLLFLYFVTLHADKLNIQIQGTVRFNTLLALPMLVVMMVRLRLEFFRIDKWLIISIAAIFCSITISMVGSPHRIPCILHGIWFIWTMLCYLWLPYQLFSRLDTKKVLSLYFGSFFVVGIYALLQIATGPRGDPFVGQYVIKGLIGRPNALCYEPSYYVLYMCPFVIHQTVLYLGRSELVSGKKLAMLHVMFFASFSAGVMGSLLTFFLVICFFRNLRKRALTFGLKVFLATLPLFFLFSTVAVKFFFKSFSGKEHHSVYERWEDLVDCYTLFKQRPVTGYGLGAITKERAEQELHWKVRQSGGAVSVNKPGPSNVTTEIMASLGVVGLAAFLLMIALYSIQYFKRRGSVWDDACFISLVVMLVTWQFSQSLMRPYCWVYFAFVAACLRTTPPSVQLLSSKELS